ncbi:MFS transporter [Nocardioides sp.]|uniref:MFS transporter n=1 Tax=Nocardioides sp. TaxID=35761 RepID=UPI002601B80A|nr:MFS transporter [Nocardioides sp.]
MSVWRTPGMPQLGLLSVVGFAGYAALLAVAPLWAIRGGASEAGGGLVNGVLLGATVLAQLAVPRALAAFGTRRVLAAGLLLLGLPAPAYLLSDGLVWVLALSALRGVGFGVLTVTGSAAAAQLVDPARRGRAIGAYGLAVAVPNLLLLPASVPLAEQLGFAWVFWIAALPVLGVPAALGLGSVLRDLGHDRPASTTSRTGRPDTRTLLVMVPPILVLFAVTMAGGGLLTFAPLLAGPTTAMALLLGMGLTATLARWLVGHVADRHGASRFLAPLLVVAAAAVAGCAWAVDHDRPVALVVAATVLGISYGALQNLTLVAAFAAAGPGRIPVASAAWNIGFDAGTATGAVAVGALAASRSFPVAFVVMAAVLLAAAIPALAPKQARPARRPHPPS